MKGTQEIKKVFENNNKISWYYKQVQEQDTSGSHNAFIRLGLLGVETGTEQLQEEPDKMELF